MTRRPVSRRPSLHRNSKPALSKASEAGPTRLERDMGPLEVPMTAYYGVQTAWAIENFPISGIRFPRPCIRALGFIKWAAAWTNESLGILERNPARVIQQAAREVVAGQWDEQFPPDIFQTGSGTSTNMNANEVIAKRASEILNGDRGSRKVHLNDQVNLGQSSNDVIPMAIHVAAIEEIQRNLLPRLGRLHKALR